MSLKTFDLAHDVASVVSAINEVVSLSSSLYAPKDIGGTDANIKFFTNIVSGTGVPALGGYWQTIYDAPPANANSTALMDMTFGYSSASAYASSVSTSASINEKIKVFRELSSVLQGSPDTPFRINGIDRHECFFIMVKRGLMKDELKKGSVSVVLSGTAWVTATDVGAALSFKQTVGGDYAPLFSGTTEIGQVWYQAGVIVLAASGSGLPWVHNEASAGNYWSGTLSVSGVMANLPIDSAVNGLRMHAPKVSFHNQTNLYSTVYFCRATNTEFNYSSNPTFVDADKRIRVTSGSNVLQTRTYITTIGLYDANDNLLAVAKLNKPVAKSPDSESIFRVRLDY